MPDTSVLGGAGAVFLAPTAAWVGSGLVSGVGTGVKEVLVRVPLRAPL